MWKRLVPLLVLAVQAVAADYGVPLMERWSRAELQIHYANRKVMQGPDGLIYVANDNTLLQYDGVRWQHYNPPNNSRIRDFVFNQGRLYAGTISDLLVLEPDGRGQLAWRSLIEDWPATRKEFGDVWWVEALGRHVVFLATEYLFIWDGTTMHSMHLPGKQLDFLLALDGRFWVSDRQGRLYHLDAQQQRLKAVSTLPAGVRLRAGVRRPDGRLLFFSRHRGGWWWDEGTLEPLEERLQAPLRDRFIYAAQSLPDGGLVLSTIGHGLLFLDPQLRLVRQLTRADGLFSNIQPDVALDDQGGLWSVGENGLHRLQWPSPLTRLLPEEGVESGAVSSIVDFRGEPVLLAHGLFRVRKQGWHSPRMVPVPGSTAQWFDAVVLDERHWLVARDDGFWWLEIGPQWQLRWLENIHAMGFGWQVIASRSRPGRYYGIGSGGMVMLEQSPDGRWQSRQLVKARDLAHALVEDEQGRIWAGSNVGKLYRADPSRGEVMQWGPEDGLAPGNVVPFWLDGRLAIGTTNGLKQWGGDGFVPAMDFPPFLSDSGREVYRILKDQRGNYWLRLGNRNGVLQRKGREWIWNEQPLWPIAASVSVQYYLGDDRRIWVLDGSGQVYWYDISFAAVPLALPRLSLRRIQSLREGELLMGGQWPAGRPLVLEPEQNALRFEYSLSRFLRNDATQYRSRLLGMEREWTPWTAETHRDVTNLGAGRYTLEIQARDISGRTYSQRYVDWRVMPRWYESTWAYAGYGLGLLLLTGGVFRLGRHWRVRQLERERERLNALVELRTREVRQQARKLEAMNEAKSRFFANVSHEFRTPLTLTIGPLESLVREHAAELSPMAGRYLQLALDNARRMLSLVGQILDMNRLEAGRMPLRVAEADLAAFLRQLCERFQARMQLRGLSFTTRGLEEPVLLHFDVDHLDKIVSNLLSNASKFTPEGGDVVLALEVEREQVRIRVSDSGPGVRDEEKVHVFRRYYQSRHVHNATEPGTGIGLSLCRELVRLHHGRIWVEDADGGGACFVLELPRGRDHFDAEDLVQPAVGKPWIPPVEQPTVRELGDLKELDVSAHEGRTRVLVVDDNAELRAFLRLRLQGSYTVDEAEDGEQALDCMRQEPPDVVVCDQMMPGMDGLTLLRLMRSDDELCGIPVLMLSAKTTHRDTVEGLQAGADDYLSKPFDTAELIVRLQALLAFRDRLRQQLQQTPAEEGEAEGHLPEGALQLLQQVRERMQDSAFTVEQLAGAMAMERTTLYRNCREWFDCSPSQLLRRERLARARTLLRQSEWTVAEVAYAVGFDSHAYFSRCFRQETGLSPSAYRNGS